ncbi:MAG: SDR family NAD(P)-dependent oxidoreductase [Sphingomonadaceae bacterium]
MAEPRVAVVTGASSGIGLETAKALVAQGWRVIAHGRNPERSAVAEKAIREVAKGGEVTMLVADLSLMSEAARLADEIAALTPRVDVLVNNAGGMASELVLTERRQRCEFRGQPPRPVPADRAAFATAASGGAGRRAGHGEDRQHLLGRQRDDRGAGSRQSAKARRLVGRLCLLRQQACQCAPRARAGRAAGGGRHRRAFDASGHGGFELLQLCRRGDARLHRYARKDRQCRSGGHADLAGDGGGAGAVIGRLLVQARPAQAQRADRRQGLYRPALRPERSGGEALAGVI